MKGIVFASLTLFQAAYALSKAPSSTSEEVVTVTTTRTFTNYCGCGIPGVSTVIGPIPGSTTTTTSCTTTDTSRTTEATSASSTTTDSTTTSSLSATTTTLASSASTSTNDILTSSTTTTTTTAAPTTTSSTTTTTSSTSTTTTTSAGPIVTDEAYIDTVLRHHNRHRSNHTAAQLTWSPSLAETARIISQSCVYTRDTTLNGGGYGQTIGAGYPSTAMGPFITEGIYNYGVNAYTAYGSEPDYSDVGVWGDFTQIVWRSTTSVGCYTFDCSNQAGGLQKTVPGVPPFFTVCNYAPAGNVVGAFDVNVGAPLGFAPIYGNYKCSTAANCVGPTN